MSSDQRDLKIFAGPQIRRLRHARGLSQARMAEDLGISPSYQNLIERNQRPLTAQVLLRLVEVYDVDLKEIAVDEDSGALTALREVFTDPFFADHGVSERDLRDVVAASPAAAGAVAALYRAWRDSQTAASLLAEKLAGSADGREGVTARLPVEEVRDFFHDRLNHFPALDEAAEALHEAAELDRDEPYLQLRAHLRERHGVGVRVVPREVMPTALRRYDYHQRRVLLSELLDQPARSFQLGIQIALFEQREAIESVVAEAKFGGEESQRVCRIGLASYFAGALLLPYERFRIAAETLRHDVEALSRRFGTNFEQVCHRLTTLQRPGARGVPFFMIRLDSAGNVTKRFSPTGFTFARSGGACPRWNVHDTFRTPGRIVTQVIELPDGGRYFSIARTVARPLMDGPQPEQWLSVGIGCDIAHAGRVVYADGIDLAGGSAVTPIGVNCFLCERDDCGERAFPPLKRPMALDENVRGISSFSFTSKD